MKDVSQGQGRTVLFVSHNMTSVKSLCHTGILLENGMLKEMGPVEPIVAHYLRGNSEIDNYKHWKVPELREGGFELLEIGVRKYNGVWDDLMRVDQKLEIYVKYRLTEHFNSFWVNYHMKNEQGEKMFSMNGGKRCYPLEHNPGVYEQSCYIPANFLNYGTYALDIMAVSGDGGIHHLIGSNGDDILTFSVENKEVEMGTWMYKEPGDITPLFEFKEIKILE